MAVMVGLGSTLSDSVVCLRAAVACLEQTLQVPIACSRFWRSVAVDCPPNSPDFTNAVVMFNALPELTPQALLQQLQGLELTFGRVRTNERNAPRTLDLDLLVFDDMIVQTDALILPHPRAHQRHFVMVPAAELAPDLVWPAIKNEDAKTVSALLSALPVCRWGEPID